MPTFFSARPPRAWLWSALAAAAAVTTFAWILDLDFWLDDFMHLYNLANNGYLRLVLTPHGGHLFLTTNTAYFVLRRLFGLWARPWFAVVLTTHAVNAMLLARALYAWTGRAALSALVAALWAL